MTLFFQDQGERVSQIFSSQPSQAVKEIAAGSLSPDKPHNGITLCTGSLGSNPKNDIPAIIKAAAGRIPFAHVRNLKYNHEGDFEEAAHLSSDGSMDMYAVLEALYETGFNGIIRPDHGRMIWGEEAMPGYGLYDRALGACYLNGVWEALEKNAEKR